jgi:hypothetical protein
VGTWGRGAWRSGEGVICLFDDDPSTVRLRNWEQPRNATAKRAKPSTLLIDHQKNELCNTCWSTNLF